MAKQTKEVEVKKQTKSSSKHTIDVKNNFQEIDKKYNDLLIKKAAAKKEGKAEEVKHIDAELKTLKVVHKEELKLAKTEVAAIAKLNKISKGEEKVEMAEDNAIEVKHIGKYYANGTIIFKALHDVNLEFKKGTFNVILGPSGSGKTTLLNMISGLDRATTGEVVIDGTNIQALSQSRLTEFRADKIGFVFQSYNLLSSLNVWDNIDIGRDLQSDKEMRMNIDTVLKDIDMSAQRKKWTSELSGGQQQRVSIARAISKSPRILIGDEPTGALDGKTSVKVFQLFQKINEELGTTVVIVTHNRSVAELAHQVIHVKDGNIAEITHNKKPKRAEEVKDL